MLMQTSAAALAAAAEDLRPHCKAVGACKAKTPGKHCGPCAAATPECRARRSAAQHLLLQDPAALARRQAGARRVSADPAILERRNAAMIEAIKSPEVKQRHRRGCQLAAIRAAGNPAAVARWKKFGRDYGPLNFAHAHTPEAREKAVLSIKEAKWAWCPPRYRALACKLKAQGHRLPARKRMIADLITVEGCDHELAANYLRRIAPIGRCDANGAASIAGSHWRFGSRVMTRVDVILLALKKGARREALAL